MATISITVEAANSVDAMLKQQALEAIAQNLTKDNLLFIAEKARKQGVNEKINKFKSGPFKNAL